MVQLPGYAPTPSLAPSIEPDRNRILSVLQRRRWLFASIVIGFVLLVALSTKMSPKSYTTHVKFIAGKGGGGAASVGDTQLPVLNALLEASNSQSSETYAEMLRQTPAVERAIGTLHLDISPGALLGHVKVKPVTNTSIIDVSVGWSDPKTSAQIANTLADGFVQVRRDLIASQARSAMTSLDAQLPGARAAMQSSAAALASFQSRNGIADADAQTQAALAALNTIEAKQAAAQIDRRQAAAQLGVVTGQLAAQPTTVTGGRQVAPNPVAAQLRSQLSQIDVQLQTAQQQYTDEHPTVRSLKTQRDELAKALAATPATVVAQEATIANPVRQQLAQQQAMLRAQIASDDAQLSTLGKQLQEAQPNIRRLPLRTTQLAALKRQAKLDEDIFNALQHKYDEAKVAETTTLSDVSVIARANASDAEVRPSLFLNVAVGFVIALFLGLTGALIADRLDHTIKTEDDVQGRLSLPVLAEMPMLPERTAPPTWVRAAFVDALLQLVTSLRYASSERLRTIAFTSPGSADGKSFVALDAAVALAELHQRVLIVDADLRLPAMHRRLNASREPGLSDVLVATATFEEAVQSTQHAGLDVITAGTRVPNAFALLQSPSFDRFMEAAREKYDVIVLDTPACGAVTDAAVVCGRADGVVYVVASHQTDIGAAERGLSRLRNAGVRNVLGAVLNKVTPRRTTIGAYGEVTDGTRSFPLPPPRNGPAKA